MIDETDIDTLADEIDSEVLPELDDKPINGSDEPRRSVGYKTLGVATLIAALLGAGGGGLISKFTAPSPPNLFPLKTQIETTLSDNKALKDQLARLQQDLQKDIKKRDAKTSTPKVDLSGIKSRLTELENAEPQTIEVATPIDPDLVARLEALQSEGSDALDLSDILARLESLETKDTMESTLEPRLTPADREALLAALKSDLMTDESSDSGAALTPPIQPLNVNVPNALPTFPKAAILGALLEADQSGWLKRTLNKRITVQSDENPRYLVKLIELDLEAGHISDALMKFDKLPETAKMAAQDWRGAFKDNK